MGEWGMTVRFIEAGANTQDCLGTSSVVLWKKSSLVFIKPKSRPRVQKLHGIGLILLKTQSSFAPCLFLAYSLVPSCAALLYSGSSLESVLGVAFGAHEATIPTRLLHRENTQAHGWEPVIKWERERETLPFLTLDYITLGLERTRCSFKLTNPFPILHRFVWGSSSNQFIF